MENKKNNNLPNLNYQNATLTNTTINKYYKSKRSHNSKLTKQQYQNFVYNNDLIDQGQNDAQYLENNFPFQVDLDLTNNANSNYNFNYENPFLRNRKYSQHNIEHKRARSSISHTPSQTQSQIQTPTQSHGQEASSQSSNKRNSKMSKYKLKAFAGDPTDKTLLENHGMRVRYEDYTTIDWIHDHVRDKARIRKIRNRVGIKGKIIKFWDKSVGWMIVIIIGFLCGIVAAGIEISSKWIFDRKLGYCRRSFSLNRELCCRGSSEYICDEWVTWGSLFTADEDKSYIINWIFYGFIASILGLISVAITSLSVKSSKDDQIEKIERHYKEPNLKNNNANGVSNTQYGSISPDENNILNDKGKNPVNDNNVNHEHIGYSYQNHKNYIQEKPEKIYCYAAGSGLPEIKTMLSGFVIRGFLGLKTLIVKVFGLIFAISAGLAIGIQGPLVHICSCIGNIVSRCFKKYKYNEAKKREIISAACSSGVAVAFGAPIGGVLFSFEEVSYYFPQKTMWRSFISAMVAAVTLKYTNPYRTGKAVLFEVIYNKPWHYFELFYFALIGVLGGLFGTQFIKIHLKWRKIRKSLKFNKFPIIEVVIISLISGLLGYINSYARIGNTELVGDLFKECDPKNKSKHSLCDHNESFELVVKDLLQALLIKIFLTTITLCIRVPCGYFVPTLVMGALSGRIIGICLSKLITLYPSFSLFSFCGANGECITPGVYAMLGAAAALCGVTRMTISLVVIMFELTGGVSYVIPIMITILAAKWTADAINKNSIFDCLIEENDYPYLNNKRIPVHQKSVVDIMDTNVLTLEVNYKYSVDELIDILNNQLLTNQYSDDGGFPVLDNGMLVGYIAFNELEHAIYLVRKLSWDNKPCCFKRIVQNPNTEIDLTKTNRPSEKNTIKSLFDSLQNKNLIPKSLSLNNEGEEEERKALLSDFNKNDDNDHSLLKSKTVKSSPENNVYVDIQLPIDIQRPNDMASSYYGQQLQHSYKARRVSFSNVPNTYPNTSHYSLSDRLANESREALDNPSTSRIPDTPSLADNSFNSNDEDINNTLPPAKTYSNSILERIPENTDNIIDEPLVYPFPDSYYALLLASNTTNDQDFNEEGILIQSEVNDFTPWVDQAPIMISVNSSMELATEMFVRLGTRYLCVVLDGHFVGVIHKKSLIKYIKSLSN